MTFPTFHECENPEHVGDTVLGDQMIECEDCEAENQDRHDEERFEAARDARWDD